MAGIALLTLVTSFCSMSYQLLLVKSFYIYSNDVLHQCLTLGMYLLFLGLGSYVAEIRNLRKNAVKEFIKVELILCLLGASAVSAVKIILIVTEFILPQTETHLLFANADLGLYLAQIITAAIGYYSGKEIPLLIDMAKSQTAIRYNIILGISYLGGLIGAFTVPLYFYPMLGDTHASLIVALFNVLAMAFTAQCFLTKKFPYLLTSIVAAFFIYSFISVSKNIEDFFNKIIYSELRMASLDINSIYRGLKNISHLGNITQIRSPYQTIDIVPSHFLEHFKKESHTALYLNRQPQFSTRKWRTYHESFYWSGVAINKMHPRNVLILGGGDGLLANEIAKSNPHNADITLVELDEKIIDIAKYNKDILKLNESIFHKNRVHLIIDDAISFLKRSQQKYDAIYIDFPVPNTFTLSKLYSVEFYKLVAEKLNAEAYIIFDAPIWVKISNSSTYSFKNLNILYNTLLAANFKNPLIFGPSDAFIYVSNKKGIPEFDYAFLEKQNLFNKTYVNLTPLISDVKQIPVHSKYVNRLLAPKLFKK